MAFIVDRFSRYNRWDREHARYIFEINDVEYAVKEVELEWGMPQVGIQVDERKEVEMYQVYGSMEEAMQFVRLMKQLN